MRPFKNKMLVTIKKKHFLIKMGLTVLTVGRSLDCWATLRGWWCSPPVGESHAQCEPAGGDIWSNMCKEKKNVKPQSSTVGSRQKLPNTQYRLALVV